MNYYGELQLQYPLYCSAESVKKTPPEQKNSKYKDCLLVSLYNSLWKEGGGGVHILHYILLHILLLLFQHHRTVRIIIPFRLIITEYSFIIPLGLIINKPLQEGLTFC
jgi:hypothetical protein